MADASLTRRQIQAMAQAAVEQALARLPVPQLGPATVASVSSTSVLDVTVRPDGSTSNVPAQNITGLPLSANDRVMVLSQPPHGMFVVGIVHAFGGASIPVGSQLPYFGDVATPPLGYIVGAGQNVNRVTYARLFAKYGTTYGAGDGSTTFGVPDLRGRVVVYLDNLGGSDAGRLDVANTLGGSGGHQKMQQHNHGVTDPQHSHAQNVSAAVGGAGVRQDYVADGASSAFPQGISTDGASTGISIQNAGTGNAENMQPYILANGIIKV